MSSVAIDVRDYGAVADAIRVSGATATGTLFNCNQLALVSADVGKSIKITNGYTSDAIFRGTILNVTSALGGTLSGTVISTCSGTGKLIYGTDSSNAIHTACSAANLLSQTPNNKITVIGPSVSAGGGYIINSTVSSDNININFEAPIYNNVGIGSDTTIPWELGNSDITSFRMDAAGGRGPRWGNANGHDIACTGVFSVDNVGFLGQKYLTARGFGFNITGSMRGQAGSFGFDWSNCQDIHGSGIMTAVGANDPHIFSSCEDFQFKIVSDTCTNSAYKIDGCHDGTIDCTTFITGSNSAATGKIGTVASASNSGIVINHIAQGTGGKAVYVDRCVGGVKINITATNKQLNNQNGFTNNLTHAVEYGTHNSGSLNIDVTRDSDITPYTGTVYGNLTDHCNGLDTFYSTTGIVAGSVEVTGTSSPANGFRLPAAGVMELRANSGVAAVFEGLSSGVDYIQFTNAATANPSAVQINAKGSSTSIIFVQAGKGPNGFFQVNPGDATGRALVVKGLSSQTGNLMEFQNSSNTVLGFVDANGSLVCGSGALSTSATTGFIYMPTCAGTPTGSPSSHTGTVPFVYDTTNNKICIYSGGAWKKTVALT